MFPTPHAHSLQAVFKRCQQHSRVFAALLLGISAVTLLLSFFVPIYIDDIMYAIATSRIGFDGWQTNGAWPLCSSNANAPIPLTVFPGRVLSWQLHYAVSTPVAIRLLGVASFAGWLALLTSMCRKCSPDPISWQHTLAIVASLSFLGVMPLMATLTRPETLLSAAVSFYALLPFYVRRHPPTRRGYAVPVCTILLVASWFFSHHPKAAFFAPLALYALWSLRRPSSLFWHGSFLLLAITIFQGIDYWQVRMTCPESAYARQFAMQKGLQPQQLLADPLAFFSRFTSGVLTMPNYIGSALFAPEYGSVWLPSLPITWAQLFADGLIILAGAGLLAFWLNAGVRISLRVWRERRMEPQLIVPLLLLMGMVLTAGAQQGRNFYDVLYIWFAGVTLTMILLQQPGYLTASRRRNALAGLGVIAFLSQCVLLSTFWVLPGINDAANSNGGISGQWNSVSMLHYDSTRKRILDFAAQCDIHPDQRNDFLIVDLYTYLPFRESYRPVYVKHLDNEVLSYAKAHESAGLVTQCAFLPDDVMAIAVQDNGLCCVSRKAIEGSAK